MCAKYCLPIRLKSESPAVCRWLNISIHVIPLPIIWLALQLEAASVITAALSLSYWLEDKRLKSLEEIRPEVLVNGDAEWILTGLDNERREVVLLDAMRLPYCHLLYLSDEDNYYRLLIRPSSNDVDNRHRLNVFLLETFG